MHEFYLALGDVPEDAYAMTYRYKVVSNCSVQEISTCYKKGVARIGFDLVKGISKAHILPRLDEQQVILLKQKGYPVETLADWESACLYELVGESEEAYVEALYLNTKEYAELFRFFVQTGHEGAEEALYFEWVKDETPVINLGGGGFFRSE